MKVSYYNVDNEAKQCKLVGTSGEEEATQELISRICKDTHVNKKDIKESDVNLRVSLEDMKEKGGFCELLNGEVCLFYEGKVIGIKDFFECLAKEKLKKPEEFLQYMESQEFKDLIEYGVNNYDYLTYNVPRRKYVRAGCEFTALSIKFEELEIFDRLPIFSLDGLKDIKFVERPEYNYDNLMNGFKVTEGSVVSVKKS